MLIKLYRYVLEVEFLGSENIFKNLKKNNIVFVISFLILSLAFIAPVEAETNFKELDSIRTELSLQKDKNAPTYLKTKQKLDKLIQQNNLDYSVDSRLEDIRRLIKEQKYNTALYEINDLIENGQELSSCYMLLGDIAQKTDKTPKIAANFYKLSIQNNRENYFANYKLAKLYLKENRNILGIENLKETVEKTDDRKILDEIEYIIQNKITPQSRFEANNLYEILGEIYKKTNRLDDSFKAFNKALQINPNDIFLKYYLGDLYYCDSKNESAIAVYDSILKENPSDTMIRATKAKALLNSGNLLAADQEFRTILNYNPDSTQAKYGLYKVYERKLTPDKILEKIYSNIPNYKVTQKECRKFAELIDEIDPKAASNFRQYAQKLDQISSIAKNQDLQRQQQLKQKQEQIRQTQPEKQRLEQQKLEQERLAQEKQRLEQEKLEQERLAQEKLRLEAQKKEQLRIQQEEEKRIAELKAKEEQALEKARLAEQKAKQKEAQRLAKLKAEEELKLKQQEELEQLKKEQDKLEQLKQEQLRQEELKRLEKEKLDKERIEKERLEKLKQEQLKQQQEQEKILKEKQAQAEKLKQQQLEKEKQQKLIQAKKQKEYEQKAIAQEREKAIKKDSKRYAEFKATIDKYMKINPKDALTYTAIANTYKLMGEPTNALVYYKEALKLNPTDSDTYYNLGLTYMELNSLITAKANLIKAINLDENNSKAINLLAFVNQKIITQTVNKAYGEFENKNYIKASEILDEGIKSYPKNAQLLYYRALVYDAMKRNAAQIIDLQKAIEFDPGYYMAYYQLGRAYEKINDERSALVAYEKFLSTEPEDKDLIDEIQKKVLALGAKYY